jgi:ABC-2 type transport system ATP-binding protein
MTRRRPISILEAMTMDSLDAVRIRGLRKTYGELTALDGVDLTVSRGEVLALLGPNGAGKTTLVEILEGHRRADSGQVSVLGYDPGKRERAFRERIGIVLQEAGLDTVIKVREALELYGAAYRNPRPAQELLELVGLDDRGEYHAAELSGGQRRRLDLALGLVGDPDLIFLDEPTTGFDPAARRQSWETIANLRTLGKSILLTTHYMEEAQRLADRVVVLAKGRVVAEGTPEELGRDDASALVGFRLPAFHDSLPLPACASIERGMVSFRTPTPTRDLAPLLEWAAGRGMELEHLTITRPTLEDVYLDLTTEEAA